MPDGDEEYKRQLSVAAVGKVGKSHLDPWSNRGTMAKQVLELDNSPMLSNVRTTDAKARLSLPKAFANATVVIEQVSDTELRIRKAKIVPEDEYRFSEENEIRLSDQDRDRFLELLENPPKPNAALRKLFADFQKRNG